MLQIFRWWCGLWVVGSGCSSQWTWQGFYMFLLGCPSFWMLRNPTYEEDFMANQKAGGWAVMLSTRRGKMFFCSSGSSSDSICFKMSENVSGFSGFFRYMMNRWVGSCIIWIYLAELCWTDGERKFQNRGDARIGSCELFRCFTGAGQV